MLEDLFSKFHKKYHIIVSEDGKCAIAEDCPRDLFEEQREIDAEYFQESGKHLYTNFEAEPRK